MPLQVSLREGATQPPPRLFERDLIAAMERHGIGTDATVAGEHPLPFVLKFCRQSQQGGPANERLRTPASEDRMHTKLPCCHLR